MTTKSVTKESTESNLSNNNFGIVSVVLGILSLICIFTFFIGSIAGFLLGIIGFFFGLKQARLNKNSWSTAGMVLSVLGLVLSVAVFVWFVITVIKLLAQFQQLVQNNPSLVPTG
jgi:hypothetical protein